MFVYINYTKLLKVITIQFIRLFYALTYLFSICYVLFFNLKLPLGDSLITNHW